jgi:bifunctional non-homologous end joining protein LigD
MGDCATPVTSVAGSSRRVFASCGGRHQPVRHGRPTVVNPPRERGLTWIEPKLVAQVRFTERTHDRHLRHPVFLELRDDKPGPSPRIH